MRGIHATTSRGSRYVGEIEVDLATRWVRFVHMNEFILSTTTVAMPGGAAAQEVRSVNDRQCTIRLQEVTDDSSR